MLTFLPQKHLIFVGAMRKLWTVGAMKSPGAAPTFTGSVCELWTPSVPAMAPGPVRWIDPASPLNQGVFEEIVPTVPLTLAAVTGRSESAMVSEKSVGWTLAGSIDSLK